MKSEDGRWSAARRRLLAGVAGRIHTVFRENARDVLNKQNPQSVTATLNYLAGLF